MNEEANVPVAGVFVFSGNGATEVLRAIRDLTEAIESLEEGQGTASGDEDGDSALTVRELEVVSLITQGLTNHEIGRRLNIELATVKNHVHNVFAKLGIKRRAQAAAWFHQRYGGVRDRP